MTPETKKYLQEVHERASMATPGEWYVAEVPRMNSIPQQKIRSKDGAIDHAVAEAWGGYGLGPYPPQEDIECGPVCQTPQKEEAV